MSKAAVIAQNLLDMSAVLHGFPGDPAKYANQIVGQAWKLNHDAFSGKFGQRPHKITVALYSLSLACSTKQINESKDVEHTALMYCIGEIINELNINSDLYPFNSLDIEYQQRAISILTE